VSAPNFCYGSSEEGPFYGQFDSREEAVKDGYDGPDQPLFTGRLVHATEFVKTFKLAETVVETAWTWLYDEIKDDDLISLSAERESELDKIIRDFLIEHADFPVMAVRDVERYEKSALPTPGGQE
jgi:hypothetical protein